MYKGSELLMINRVRGLASPSTILAGLFSFCLSTLACAAGPGWYDSFEQATQAARQQGRPIFVDFSTSWCSVCKQMDRTTLSDPGIVGRLDNFIKIKVDGDARPDLVSTYGVEAYPTFLHLDSSGRVLDKREGFMRSQELAGTLDRIWQGVSASMAIAQANQKPDTGQPQQLQQPGAGAAPQAQQEMMLSAPNSKASPTEVSTSAQRNSGGRTTSQPAPAENLYNTADAQLQGNSVYAMGSGPTSQRRSRFGGTVTQGGGTELRELAEATAQPGAMDEVAARTDGQTPAPAERKIAGVAIDETTDKPGEKPTEKASKAIAAEKVAAVEKVKKEIDAKATAKPSIVMASAGPSPVIQSRLSGLSEAQLPKPLLSRTSSKAAASEPVAAPVAAETKTASATTATADPLATIRRIQGDDVGTKPTPVSTKPVTIAATKNVEEKAPQAAGEAATEEKVVAKGAGGSEKSASEITAKSESSKSETSVSENKTKTASSDDTKAKTEGKKSAGSDSKETAKTAEGATKSDIERWMKDADGKLVSERKTEARAMYSKVVEKDPKNQFGKSDTAYVKMVSLIVDKDSDPLRRQAYNKIKEFEARFPDSDHKDYYTLIRAILAADLGETNEAHKLLGTYADRFPDSKYLKVAHDTWKSLPSAKKESASSAKKESASKSKTKSSANSGSSKSSKKSDS